MTVFTPIVPLFTELKYTACLIIFLLAACTRSSIPLSGTEAPPDSIPSQVEPELTEIVFDQSATLAVVWVPDDANLTLHNPAGIAGTVVGEVSNDQRGITLTGNTTGLGSSLWVEIQTVAGMVGWVNTWNLTEDVPSADFCDDVRVIRILESFTRALDERDTELLASITNPKRGLLVRHDWWNPEVFFTKEAILALFEDLREIDWGVLSGGEFKIKGSFRELMTPLLEEVFTGEIEAMCNALPIGMTSKEARWPSEYSAINYYAFHRPAPEGGNQFDWRTWVLGFEYIDGYPYLSILIQYHGDV